MFVQRILPVLFRYLQKEATITVCLYHDNVSIVQRKLIKVLCQNERSSHSELPLFGSALIFLRKHISSIVLVDFGRKTLYYHMIGALTEVSLANNFLTFSDIRLILRKYYTSAFVCLC